MNTHIKNERERERERDEVHTTHTVPCLLNRKTEKKRENVLQEVFEINAANAANTATST